MKYQTLRMYNQQPLVVQTSLSSNIWGEDLVDLLFKKVFCQIENGIDEK